MTRRLRLLLLSGLVATVGACTECVGNEHACIGNTARVCVGGEQVGPERWVDTPCGDRFCVVNRRDTTAFCALSRDPDPICEPTDNESGRAFGGYACSDSTLIECYYGYRTKEWSRCSSPESCASAAKNQSRSCS